MFSAQKIVFGSLLKGYKTSRIFEIALLNLYPLRRDPNWSTDIIWSRNCDQSTKSDHNIILNWLVPTCRESFRRRQGNGHVPLIYDTPGLSRSADQRSRTHDSLAEEWLADHISLAAITSSFMYLCLVRLHISHLNPHDSAQHNILCMCKIAYAKHHKER